MFTSIWKTITYSCQQAPQRLGLQPQAFKTYQCFSFFKCTLPYHKEICPWSKSLPKCANRPIQMIYQSTVDPKFNEVQVIKHLFILQANQHFDHGNIRIKHILKYYKK